MKSRDLPLVFVLLAALNCFAQVSNANIWVNTTAGSCVRNSTPAAYNAATACGNMQAAQNIANGGDTVVMKNGTYPAQSLSGSEKTSAVSYYAETPSSCQDQPATAATCTGSVQIDAHATALNNQSALTISIDHVHIYGIVSAGSGETRGGLDVEDHSGTDILVDGFAGKNFFAAASGLTVEHGEYGNFNACNGFTPGTGCSVGSDCATEDGTRFWGDPAPQNDKLLNSTVHDVSAPPDGTCGSSNNEPHVDAMQIYQSSGTANNIVIDGNLFFNNATSGLQAGGSSMSNFTIQNNYYGPTVCCNNLVWGQASLSGSFIVRNNVMANPNGYIVVNNAGASGSPTYDFSSNIIIPSNTACAAGGSLSGGDNVFVSGGATCATSVKACTPNWLNGTPSSSNGYDIRLNSADTCAIGAANPTDFAPTDFYGTNRPQGAKADAGAYELPALASGTPNPPTGLTAAVN